MDSLEPLPDTYSLQQGPIPISILPIELTMDSTEGAPRYVQNFLVRHMDDSRMELVNVETQEIFNLNLASLASNAVETAGSELNKSPSESDNGTLNNQRGENESVIQYSSSAQTTTTSSLENQKSDITSYLCFTCNDYFKSLSLYRRHVKCHRVEKEFTCQKCLMGFNVETNLKIHSITNHPTTTNICPFCKVSFTRQASLRSHILVHQVEELIICDKCDAEFLNDDDLLRHMESHALTKTKISAPVDDIACTQCELNFLSQSELSLHMAKHNEPKRHKYAKVRKGRNRWFMIGNCRCQYCGKDFPKEWLLDRHLRIHTGEKPFKCQLCGKGFTQKGSLRIHMDKHKGLKPYSCSHCSARFSQKGNLKAHIQKTHIVPNGGPHKIFRCSHCSCIFRKLATLNGHMTKAHLGYPEGAEEGHTEVSSNQLSIVKLAENHANGSVRRYTVRQKKIGDVRWYFCNYCSAKFKKPSDLIRHFRTHTLEKPFKCLVCGQAFSLKLTLKNHMKLHVRVPAPKVLKESGIELSQKEPLHASVSTTPKASQLDEEKVLEKPFQCKVCSAFFTGSLSLGKHMLLHNAGRQLKCSLCTKTFATKYGLKEHTNHHQNKQIHTCETCPKKFATASLLKRHSFVHSKVKPSTCPYCTKSFKTVAMCRTHIKTGHSLPSEGDAAEIAPRATEDEVLNKVPAEGESLGVEQVYEPLETDMPSVAPIPQAVPLDIAPEIPTLTGNSRDYQMVYLNFNDLPNATTMEDSIINPSSKLQNIFNPITDVLFNTYPDVLVEKPIESATAHQQQETPPAVADVLPINVIDATALNEVPLDAQVYCINCHRMFSDCYSFERHVCLPDDSVVKLVLNDQQAGEEVNKSVCYENKNLKVSNSSEMDVSPMKRFSDKKSLIADIQKLEQPKQFRCDHCTYVTSVEERYRRHLLLHPSLSDRVCKFCCKFFRKPSDLKRHLRTHTGEKPYECECCRKKFALKSTLESHLRTHDVVGQAKISCDVCHANFTSRSSLKVHMLLHTGERPYSCKFCEQAFRTLSILKAHEKRHANRLSESANDLKEIAPVSQITPADAAQQEAMVIFNPLEWMPLDVLQQIEEGSGIVIAQEVGGDGTTASNVGQEAEMEESKSAKRTKDKQQKVECDICHKVYSSKDVLRKHKKALHGQNKKFPCIKCDKGYDQLEDLNKHIKKLHSGLRPYACQYCSNSFGEEHSLKTHIKRIHQKSLFAQETKNALRSLQLDLSSEEHNFF